MNSDKRTNIAIVGLGFGAEFIAKQNGGNGRVEQQA